jgi:hypothetical protein
VFKHGKDRLIKLLACQRSAFVYCDVFDIADHCYVPSNTISLVPH